MEQSCVTSRTSTRMCRPLIVRPVKCSLAKLAWPAHSWGPAESDWLHSSNVTSNASSWPSVGQQLVRSIALAACWRSNGPLMPIDCCRGCTHARSATHTTTKTATTMPTTPPTQRQTAHSSTHSTTNDSARNKSTRSLDARSTERREPPPWAIGAAAGAGAGCSSVSGCMAAVATSR
jgi:hypothetical protein